MGMCQSDLANADSWAMGSGIEGRGGQRGSCAENEITTFHERVIDTLKNEIKK